MRGETVKLLPRKVQGIRSEATAAAVLFTCREAAAQGLPVGPRAYYHVGILRLSTERPTLLGMETIKLGEGLRASDYLLSNN